MNTITVETTINNTVQKVWKVWTEPDHIINWCQASDDWHAPAAKNDLRVGGSFSTTMAAKDKSSQFDFAGIYTKVIPNEIIEYVMSDGRKVKIVFEDQGHVTKITETFDPEGTNSLELQRNGWQSILDSFKRYVESRQHI
ncbi:MAG: SRPBCC family protein [Microgenomates group bacterium]